MDCPKRGVVHLVRIVIVSLCGVSKRLQSQVVSERLAEVLKTPVASC